MHESSTRGADFGPPDAGQLARSAWDAREADPRRAVELARAAIQERPGAAASGLAQAAVAVASAHLNDPEEVRAAAAQVPQLLNEVAAEDLPDGPAILVETGLAALRAASLLGDLAEGVRAGRQAIEQAQQHGLAALEARAHAGLGALFGSRGMASTALKHMRSGLTVLEANDLPVPPGLLNNLGNVYFVTGGADEALGFYTRARQKFQADGDLFGAAQARSNEGRALLNLERVSEALEALEEGVSLLDQFQDHAYYGAALSKAAAGHAAAGNRQLAEARFSQALRAAADLGGQDPFEDEIRRQYGDFLRQVGRQEEALQQYEAALEVARARQKLGAEVEVLQRSSELLAEMRRYEQAYRQLHAYCVARGRLQEESGDTLLRHQLIELESSVGATHELSLVARMAMVDANRELRERTRVLQDLSATDDLTQLFNRRYFRARLAEEEALALSNHGNLALLLLDVDYFKSVNDRFSHTVGDAVLVEFSGLLRHAFRAGDVVARWGGEEFAVLLPGFDPHAAGAVAERARQQIEAHDWQKFGAGLALTVSIGISGLTEVHAADGAQGRPESLLELADARLYDAKRLGRNRVIWK